MTGETLPSPQWWTFPVERIKMYGQPLEAAYLGRASVFLIGAQVLNLLGLTITLAATWNHILQYQPWNL